VSRRCARPGCGEEAVATLRYVYADMLVWIEAIDGAHEPNDYDLCLRHGARVKVPNGWVLDDRRHPFTLAS
jgi:hypothetical protein